LGKVQVLAGACSILKEGRKFRFRPSISFKNAGFVTNAQIRSADGLEDEFTGYFSRQIVFFGGTISITIT
jgi:hypothetical protein